MLAHYAEHLRPPIRRVLPASVRRSRATTKAVEVQGIRDGQWKDR